MPWISQRDLQALRSENRSIRNGIVAIFNMLGEIMATQAQVRDALTGVSAGVAAEVTALDAVEQLLTNMAQKITDLANAAANADVPQDILDQITALGLAVTNNKDRLVADVARNTPQAPDAPPAPPVDTTTGTTSP